MSRLCALLGSFTVMVVGLGQSSVQAATAIAMDDRGVVYRVSRTSIDQANVDALSYCRANDGFSCRMINTNVFNGYGAVAQSPSRTGTAMGYSSQEEADQGALESCRKRTPDNETCRVILQYVDKN
jgi:Domain of unknown function (DUF4189)